MRMALCIVGIVVLVGFSACRREQSGVVITGLSSSECSCGDYTIETKISSSNLLVLVITSEKKSVFEYPVGSVYSRWLVYFRTCEEIWVYSGDSGIFLFKRIHAKGQKEPYYQIITAQDESMPSSLPAPIYDALPQSVRSEWRKG